MALGMRPNYSFPCNKTESCLTSPFLIRPENIKGCALKFKTPKLRAEDPNFFPYLVFVGACLNIKFTYRAFPGFLYFSSKLDATTSAANRWPFGFQ